MLSACASPVETGFTSGCSHGWLRTLHLLALCYLAVRVAHRRCAPPLHAGPGGAPRTYSEASLLLIGLLRTLWRLSYQDMHDWLRKLACVGFGLRFADGQRWTDPHSKSNLNSVNAAMLLEL